MGTKSTSGGYMSQASPVYDTYCMCQTVSHRLKMCMLKILFVETRADEFLILSETFQAVVYMIRLMIVSFFSTKAAKMANYAKCQILCNLLFAMFAILFISSRLGVYPVW